MATTGKKWTKAQHAAFSKTMRAKAKAKRVEARLRKQAPRNLEAREDAARAAAAEHMRAIDHAFPPSGASEPPSSHLTVTCGVLATKPESREQVILAIKILTELL